MAKERFAVILIRSRINVKPDIKKTLDLLNLRQRNVCVLVPNTASNLGKIRKVKDYVTYGIINEETEKLLLDKRGAKDKEGKPKKFFRLNSPKKGYGRKGIKVPFTMGGGLGDRKDKINDLIKRML
jgi:large subunit ribosomal protein L30